MFLVCTGVVCQDGPRHLNAAPVLQCTVLSSLCPAGCYTQTVQNFEAVPDDLKQYSTHAGDQGREISTCDKDERER